MESPFAGVDDAAIDRFGFYASKTYVSALSLASLADDEEERQEPADLDEERRRGKIALEALDRITTIHSILRSSNAAEVSENQRLQHEEHYATFAQSNGAVLEECGLLDLRPFVEAAGSDGNGKDLLGRYVSCRDAVRRDAHQSSMLHRQTMLRELIEEAGRSEIQQLTTVESVRDAMRKLQQFVRKNIPRIGTHSLIAGLMRIIDLQLNPTSDECDAEDADYVVRWTFAGSVLTEACTSEDELAFAREAVSILLLVLVSADGRGDVESGVKAEGGGVLDATQLSFEIRKDISNANLKRLLSVLKPEQARLETRATGTCSVVDGGMICQRSNVDGRLDEQWPWFAALLFCNIL